MDLVLLQGVLLVRITTKNFLESSRVPSEVSPTVLARPGTVSLMRSDEIIAWGGNGFCKELHRFRE